MPLITAPHFDTGDDFYEALLSAHHGMEADASHAFNARLILLLANHIGRQDVLLEALSAAALAHPVPASSPVSTASPVPSAPIDAPTPGDASPRGQA